MKAKAAKPSGSRQPYEPSAKDIRRECERIQARWTARERKRRAGQTGQTGWVPPSVDWMSLADAVSEGDAAAAIRAADSPW